MQSALVHHTIAHHAPGFLIVAGKVLDAAAHAGALHTADEGGAHFTGEHRILAEVLEVATAQRAPLDVETRPQQQRHILRLALLP